MRLYLSSFGLGNRPDELVRLVGHGRRAAVIVNALDNRPEARGTWLRDQSDALAALGFDALELDLRRHFGRADALVETIAPVDLVWITGGNAFLLRRAMRQSGFDRVIKQRIERDTIVYAGFSAGAVVAAPDLHGLDLIDDPNDIGPGYEPEVVWDGLGLVPFAIAVHVRSDHPESAAVDAQIAHYETSGRAYQALRDGQALVISGDRQEIVG